MSEPSTLRARLHLVVVFAFAAAACTHASDDGNDPSSCAPSCDADAASSDEAHDAGDAMGEASGDAGPGDASAHDDSPSDAKVADAADDVKTDAPTSPYGAWRSIAEPPARFVHPVVQEWTGKEAIFYDGASGAAYDPKSDHWRTLPIASLREVGATLVDFDFLFVYANTYDATGVARGTTAFSTDASVPGGTGLVMETSLTGRPGLRTSPIVRYTGKAVLVFGGTGSSASPSDGGQYDVSTDTWSPLPSTGAPSGGASAIGEWTGHELLVWGGCTAMSSGCLNGGLYDPLTKTWRPMSSVDAPAPRAGFVHAFAGAHLYVWGGVVVDASGSHEAADGGVYSVKSDTWTPLPSTTLGAREEGFAAWIGSELVVWSGESSTLGLDWNDGAQWEPLSGAWTPVSIDRSPGGCHAGGAVWTGTELVVVGGLSEVSSTAGCGAGAWTPPAWL